MLRVGERDADNIFWTSKEKGQKAKNKAKQPTATNPVPSPTKPPKKKSRGKGKSPSSSPSSSPSFTSPSSSPSFSPTSSPSSSPSLFPTSSPSSSPSSSPTPFPSLPPSSSPSLTPSSSPTLLIRSCQVLRFPDGTRGCPVCGGSYITFFSGVVGPIVSFESPTNGVTPTSIEFVVGAVNCGASSSTVVLNGRAQGSYSMSYVCDCTSVCVTSSVIEGTVADFNPSGTNTITINANSISGNPGADIVGSVQVCIEYPG
jgi:hypothetical protein